MQTAKLFMNGQSQAVRLPKECRFPGTEVSVRKVGEMVILYPKERALEICMSSFGAFSDDFMEDGRGEELESPSDPL